MTPQEVKRKLAAIFSADVKGYSRLMGEDEEGTIRTLNTYKEVMSNLIQQQRGRVVDAPGDNVLAEFGSVVDAVRCAVEIQKELKTRNGDLPENRRMEFRIGVNLGDVVEDGEQILGDGVNIAARLESLSETGGICISGTAFDQVRNKLELGYEYLGEQSVKNIALPVRVYRVLTEPEAVGKVIGEKTVDVPSKDIDLACAFCLSSGRDPYSPKQCRVCKGKGRVKVSDVDRRRCRYCNGSGRDPYSLSTCQTCGGLGLVPGIESPTIPITPCTTNILYNDPTEVSHLRSESVAPMPSSVLKVPKGAISIWVYINPFNQGIRRLVNRYIVSHDTNQGNPKDGKYFNVFSLSRGPKFFDPPRDPMWKLWITNDAGESCSSHYPDSETLRIGWHHFLVRWDHNKPLLELLIDGSTMISRSDYLGNWPNRYATNLLIGTWANKWKEHYVDTFLYRAQAIDYSHLPDNSWNSWVTSELQNKR